MKRIHEYRGFTIVEILSVVAIIGILTVLSQAAFRNVYRDSAVRTSVLEISDAFRDARNNTLGSQNDTVYGVRVGTSSVTRFVGSTFINGAAANKVYVFDAGVTATGTLVTSSTSVIFTRLTGVPSATGTIVVRNSDLTSSTSITIHKTGLVEY